MSIRTKMLIAFIPIILVATLLVSSVSVFESKKGLERQIEERIDTSLEKINESIEREFTSHRRIAEAIASVYKAQGNKLTKADYKAIIEKMVSLNANTLGPGCGLKSTRMIIIQSTLDRMFTRTVIRWHIRRNMKQKDMTIIIRNGISPV
nr:hypothetical protein [Thermoclostridium stercorarium]